MYYNHTFQFLILGESGNILIVIMYALDARFSSEKLTRMYMSYTCSEGHWQHTSTGNSTRQQQQGRHVFVVDCDSSGYGHVLFHKIDCHSETTPT